MDGTESGAGGRRELVARLAQDLDAPSAARALVDRLALPAEVDGRLRLGLSELVANGVRHPRRRGPVVVRIRTGAGAVRAEVTDPGDGFAWPAEGHALPPPEQIGGRGLCLVERIADRWGVEPVPGGSLAWFEVGLRVRSPAAP